MGTERRPVRSPVVVGPLVSVAVLVAACAGGCAEPAPADGPAVRIELLEHGREDPLGREDLVLQLWMGSPPPIHDVDGRPCDDRALAFLLDALADRLPPRGPAVIGLRLNPEDGVTAETLGQGLRRIVRALPRSRANGRQVTIYVGVRSLGDGAPSP